MRTKRIAVIITKALYFAVLVVLIQACDTNQGMMHGSSSTGMGNWNWATILISLGIGFLLGYLFSSIVSRKKP